MDVGHFYSPSAVHVPQSRQQTTGKSNPKERTTAKVKAGASSGVTRKAMVDNKGWRKKIGGKPKEVPSITDSDETAAPPSERLSAIDTDRRRHGWRMTIAVSRPSTPVTPASPAPTPDDTEETRSERSEVSTPRRDSKPKLMRYTSMFTTLKEEVNSTISSDPWSLDAPPTQEDRWSYVDPIVVMESIHSHMCKNYMVPVPLEYTSGLFQIFDDYRKLRSHKEVLEVREYDALQRSRKVTAQWHQSEILYEAEIRRLELLIARGTTGMTGLMNARRGTVVDRKRQHRKTISTDRILPQHKHMSPSELDQEIQSRTRQILLHRPSSPSEQMTTISQQPSGAGTPKPSVGTPHPIRESALSRKVKSELNLLDLRQIDTSYATPGAIDADLSSCTRDVVGKRAIWVDQLAMDPLECEALVALKELGVLVARCKGLEMPNFVNRLMGLLTSADPVLAASYDDQGQCRTTANEVTPKPPPREARSQPYPEGDPTLRRHFSFEPGDDQKRGLEVDLRSYDAFSQAGSMISASSFSSGFRLFDDDLDTDNESTHLSASASGELPKPTMIPSPVQSIGRVRRENSMSSLQNVFVKNAQDDRHNSRTSIQTAFREGMGANASVKSKSRSSSSQNLHTSVSPLGSKERLDSIAHRQSNVALAAARAADTRSNKTSNTDARGSTTTSSLRKRHMTGQQRTENNDPPPHSNAGKKDVEEERNLGVPTQLSSKMY